jgi:hypothetical protein
MGDMTSEPEYVAALIALHRLELARAEALLLLYRDRLEDAGISVPDTTGEEALERFRFAFLQAGLNDSMMHNELHQEAWR